MFRVGSLFFGRKPMYIEKNLQRSFSTLERTLRISERKTLVSSKTSTTLEFKRMLVSPFSTQSNEGPRVGTKKNVSEGQVEINPPISRREGQDITALSKPLANWTKDEIQQWFKSSKYSDYARKFLGLDGKDLAGLTKDDFLRRCPEMGDVIYNTVQELKAEKEKPKETLGSVIQRALKGVGPVVVSNKTPPQIPLLERDEQLEKVVTIVENNLEKMSGLQVAQGAVTGKAKTDLLIPAIIGGSGIGKTRLGYEAAQELFKRWKHVTTEQFQNAHTLYFYLDFANGYSLGFRDINLDPTQILAVRLAHAYFVAEKRLNLDFPTFLALCIEHIDLFNVEDVFLAIRADLNLPMDVPLFAILHIDEVQTMFSFEERYKSRSGKGILKDLIYEAGKFFASGSLTIQPFVSGTAHRKVMAAKEPTMYSFEFITCPLLSLSATLKLIEHYADQFGADPWEWKMNLGFLQLLGDMGGLPRAISYLLEECFGKDYSAGLDFFRKISSTDFRGIFDNAVKNVDTKYGLQGFISEHRTAALQVFGHALRGASITRDRVLGNTSVEEIEQLGHVFLQQVGTNYYFRMPFLFVSIYNKYLKIISRELADVAFNPDSQITWQSWESFNALFVVFLNNFLLQENGKISMTLGDFFHKADGHDDTKNLCIELDPLEVARLAHQFPSKNQQNLVLHKDSGKEIDWTTRKYLLLNAKSAEFGDTVLIRAAGMQIALEYFGRKVTTIVVSGQQKWDYNGEDFTIEQAAKEHSKALETAKRAGILDFCGLITVIFTTQPLPKDEIQSIPKDILIIHQGNFKDYYGPFATRAAFSIAHTFNPNFADIKHLQVLEGVGEETAKAIAKERQKRPFKNLDDLCARVPRVKKSKLTREITFFPFTSKRSLLPFEGYTKQ